jgi:hypothetical protein
MEAKRKNVTHVSREFDSRQDNKPRAGPQAREFVLGPKCVVLDEAHAVQSALSRRRHQDFWGEAAALRSRERVAVQV